MTPTFANPWALALLPLAAAALWYWSRRGRAALAYPDTRLLGDLPPGRATWARRGGVTLRAAGLVLLVLAISGPRWPDEGTRVPTDAVSIAVVLDVSASMAERDFASGGRTMSRLDGARAALRLFIAGGTAPGGEEVPGRADDLLALVTFAASPETACPLTLDRAALLDILARQEARTASGDATTNPGDALAWALHVLKTAPTRRKAVLFVTDGESNVPRGLKPRQAAQLAGNLRVPVYALDAAPDPPDKPDAGDAEKARETLRAVASMTGGAYFPASGGAALVEACRQIDRLERDRVPSFRYRRYHEAYPWFALASLACWAALFVLEATRWRTAP